MQPQHCRPGTLVLGPELVVRSCLAPLTVDIAYILTLRTQHLSVLALRKQLRNLLIVLPQDR